MVFNVSVKIPLQAMKVSRVVLVSGLLTFLYCIEFSIGIRTVYYTFKAWSDSSYNSQDKLVSWTLCVACLFTATISAFSVNVLSAMWEQKELEEREKEKSITRFAFHIVVGGMIWRYINLWCTETKEFQKKGALLLTMNKFLFTQTFTIPMVIVHVSVLEHLEEVIYDVCSIFCISVNLILTCTMFSWCSKEVEELKKWDFETVDLVPLIFQSEPPVDAEQTVNNSNNSISNSESEPKSQGKNPYNRKEAELVLIKLLVFFQTFGFSFGRLLALGILLKLAGIYAVSIMFLQLLISVIYLKFQAPILVSESLPKWRQLSRLAFMSYILIFEWQLNRDPKTGYDFSSNLKHSILYYCVATVESVFYLVTWAITTSYASKYLESVVRNDRNTFCRIILIMGSMALVFSLTIHIVLLFWRSRGISMFIYSVKCKYETTKLRLSLCGCGKDTAEKKENTTKRSNIDISSPIMIKKNDDRVCDEENKCNLEKHNSYKDLREPLDEEIEIYFRKCDKAKYSDSHDKTGVNKNTAKIKHVRDISIGRELVKTLDQQLHHEINILESSSENHPEKDCQAEVIESTANNTSVDMKDESKLENKPSESSLKSKMTILSGSINEQLGKVSSVSRKMAGTMRDQIQKRKEQFQNFRSNSSDSNKKEMEGKSKSPKKTSKKDKPTESGTRLSNESSEAVEDYFVGDVRCYDEGSLQSVKAVGKQHVSFSDQTMSVASNDTKEINDEPEPYSDLVHTTGDSPCACYICKTLGDGRFRRRRSSSVPSGDRKIKEGEDENGGIKILPRYLSNPSISENRCDKEQIDQASKIRNMVFSPKPIPKSSLNLSLMSRVEHYV